MMNTRSGGGAAAAPGVVYFSNFASASVPGGRVRAGRWPLDVGRSGRDGGFGRPWTAKRCRPTRPARREGKVGSVADGVRRAVAAEAGDSLLEPAGAAGSRSGASA